MFLMYGISPRASRRVLPPGRCSTAKNDHYAGPESVRLTHRHEFCEAAKRRARS
jgi:hypothetical protein